VQILRDFLLLLVGKLELSLTRDLSEKSLCGHSFPSNVLVNEWPS
jgi:hypothetical protein